MAVNVFPSAVGIPSVHVDPFAVPMGFSLQNFPAMSISHCVLQGVSGTTQGNYQFMLTLRNFTYVYVFGEKMGNFTVTGLSMSGGMEGGCSGNVSADSGMRNAIQYYNDYAISITGMPVAVTMAGWSAWAFLVGARFTAMNPKSQIGQFQLDLRTITQ